MVFSTRGRCNDDAMKYFSLDNKKKNGCIGGRCNPDVRECSSLLSLDDKNGNSLFYAVGSIKWNSK